VRARRGLAAAAKPPTEGSIDLEGAVEKAGLAGRDEGRGRASLAGRSAPEQQHKKGPRAASGVWPLAAATLWERLANADSPFENARESPSQPP
jgi:hypothetical protein